MRARGRWAGVGLLAPAYGLIVVLVLVPLAALLVESLTPGRVAGPASLGLLFENYLRFFRDGPSRFVLANSLTIPAVATVLCVAIGWPLAYALAKVHRRRGNALLAVLMAPFFVSYLLIIYAFMGLLQVGGPVQVALHALGLVPATTSLLYSRAAVTLALVYEYLPFMVLSIYGSLERIEDSVLEAAASLGASRLRVFAEILWPRSVPGVIAGCALVFIPATGSFVEPQILGGTRVSMLGEVINAQINQTFDLPRAATVSLVLTLAAVAGFALLALAAHATRRAVSR
ncbi:MAG: ABC transporter permease [Deinococcales bacterium]|jgi:spermidine/putrescine transport system permease protein